MKIHAWAAFKAGGQLEPHDYDAEPTPGQVTIDIDSCSLTRGDTRFIDNFWGSTVYPLVTGLEIIGRVREDNGPDASYKPGDVVGVGYQVGACFACEYCKAGKEQFCVRQQLIPFHHNGGLADAIIVDRRFVFPMPPTLQKPEATPLLCAGLTVFTPISQARLQPGAIVGVVGLGSLGHLAIQFLAAMGCTVTAFTHSQHKAELAKALGAQTVVSTIGTALSRTFDFIISTASDGVDWPRYVAALRPEGTLCVVGLPSEPMNVPADLLADRAARRIVGSYVGSRGDMERMLAFAAKHHIQAQAKLYAMDDVNAALADMRAGGVDFSAVLVRRAP